MTIAGERFVAGMIEAMGCDPALAEQPGVTVAADPGRAQNHVTAGYVFGNHLIITCDPAASDMLTGAASAIEPTLSSWRTLALELGGELLGGGPMHVLRHHTLEVGDVPPGFVLRSLNPALACDRAAIDALVARSTAEDLDAADFDSEDLDPVFHGVIDADGEIVAYASSSAWPLVAGFGDLAVLTRRDCRTMGLGRIAVASVCRSLLGDGIEPLYRCESINAGSLRLSASLGFEPVTELVAFRF